MLRKNFMKRLSKSASDLSGCKKKSHSTSPEEEQKDLAPFATPTHNSEDEEDQDRVRPSSAASTRSVPEEGYAAKKAKKHKLKHFWQQKEAVTAPSEVGIRNVGGQIHSVYRGHQVSLCISVPQFIKPLKGLWLIAVSACLVVKGLKNPKINKWEIWHCSQPFFSEWPLMLKNQRRAWKGLLSPPSYFLIALWPYLLTSCLKIHDKASCYIVMLTRIISWELSVNFSLQWYHPWTLIWFLV